MTNFYLKDGRALADAAELMQVFGALARVEAAARADQSRGQGNLAGFCHWRQIARAITLLRDEEVTGTVH